MLEINYLYLNIMEQTGNMLKPGFSEVAADNIHIEFDGDNTLMFPIQLEALLKRIFTAT